MKLTLAARCRGLLPNSVFGFRAQVCDLNSIATALGVGFKVGDLAWTYPPRPNKQKIVENPSYTIGPEFVAAWADTAGYKYGMYWWDVLMLLAQSSTAISMCQLHWEL